MSLLAQDAHISGREALGLIGRAFRYLGPVRYRFAAKAGLSVLSLLPLLVLPWPAKILVDHVINDIPLGESPTPYPAYMEPLLALLQGQDTMGIVLVLSVLSLSLIGLVGGFGMQQGERTGLSGWLWEGQDEASRSENKANEASSAAGGLLGWFEYRWQLRLTHDLNHRYRTQLFERIQDLPMTAFDDEEIGDAVYRVMYDTPTLTRVCYMLALVPITAPIHIGLALLSLLAAYAGAPLVLWVAVGILPIALLVTLPFAGVMRRLAERARETGAKTTATMEEGMSNILAVQSLGGQKRERARFDDDSWASFSAYRRLVILGIVISLVASAVLSIPAAWLAFSLTDMVMTNQLTAGDFPVIAGFLIQIGTRSRELGTLWIDVQSNVAGIHRVFALMDLPSEPTPETPITLGPIEQGVEFKGVHYQYPDGTMALSEINLQARVGQFVALVGPAGAGKTSLAYTIPRFLSPSAGAVLIDGVDVAQVSRESLRSQIGFVFQETALFDATVAENIRLAKPDASDAELQRAAEAAGAHEFIVKLPEGYDTRLGRGGGRLSVGQKQRLSIARALVRDSRILILDEPTSALDPETELRLVQALQEASKTRLVIVIAHRLSTIRSADQILFLEDGRIRERGTHQQLMSQQGGAYRAFVELQR